MLLSGLGNGGVRVGWNFDKLSVVSLTIYDMPFRTSIGFMDVNIYLEVSRNYSVCLHSGMQIVTG
jgi:hypothetical protein